MITYKKGDVVSMLLVIISVFIVGILVFFFSHLASTMYGELGDYFDGSDKFANTTVTESIDDIQGVELVVWDYAFLGIALGYFVALALTAFSTRISPVFYFIYGIIAIVGILVSVIASNVWQATAESPEFATTIARFPITDAMLGSYFPTIISGIIVLFMILLFGKPPGSDV